MPYIVTTSHTPEHEGATGYVIARRAVATLDDARAEAIASVHRAFEWDAEMDLRHVSPYHKRLLASIDRISPSGGGAIGPLPDGSIIGVDAAGFNDLLAALSQTADYGFTQGEAERLILAAFNARQSVAAA